jgi:hypothetical protein
VNGVVVVVATVSASTGLFAGWVWVMKWLDERAERQQTEQMRRREPPVLGGARHLRSGGRRW